MSMQDMTTLMVSRYAAVLVVFVSGNIAANPEPTVVVLANGNGNAAAADANILSAGTSLLPTAAAAATVTFIETATLTLSETGSMRTIFSTITSTISPTPTVIMKKGEMSGLSKAGIGVGAAVAALFVLMLLGSSMVWVSQQKWAGADGVFGIFSRERWRANRETCVSGSRTSRDDWVGVREKQRKKSRSGVRSMDGKGNEKGKQREKVVPETRAKEKDAHVVWV